uniref:Uncharacterized protein n=1 Tax=Maylandia zebra TaxID=106582 RepID=A0A3P9C9V4_9CICH
MTTDVQRSSQSKTAPPAHPKHRSSQSPVFSSEMSSSSSQSLSLLPPSSSENCHSTSCLTRLYSSTCRCVVHRTAQGTLCTPTKRPRESASGSESPRDAQQKNRRRCYRCQTKLELVQQELAVGIPGNHGCAVQFYSHIKRITSRLCHCCAAGLCQRLHINHMFGNTITFDI